LQSLSVPDLKTQAKSLRAALAASGQSVSHSQALELMAKQHGFRDWNTLHAAADKSRSFALGQRVSGTYLGQPFRGKIIGIRALADGARFGLTIRFDAPVDVVTFEGLSNLRSQVQAVVNAAGESAEKTSDGVPHLRVRPEQG
ncbi:MAG: glyoxalase superfamily protein, partial [Pseudomonadota bacterium]